VPLFIRVYLRASAAQSSLGLGGLLGERFEQALGVDAGALHRLKNGPRAPSSTASSSSRVEITFSRSDLAITARS